MCGRCGKVDEQWSDDPAVVLHGRRQSKMETGSRSVSAVLAISAKRADNTIEDKPMMEFLIRLLHAAQSIWGA
jgi:hypothetical protein